MGPIGAACIIWLSDQLSIYMYGGADDMHIAFTPILLHLELLSNMAGFILGDFNRRVRLLFMLVIVIVLNEGKGNTRAQCIERERQALLRFKQSLVLDSANLLSSWKSSDPSCCSWKQIRCDNRTNHIIMLDLHPEFRCRGYDYDCFRSHSISGKIDSALVQLQNLTRLEFFYIGFGYSNSTMTADNLEWLSYLPSLRSLTLGSINFTKAVDWLQSIKKANSLSTLNLNNCQFPEVDIWSLSQTNSSNSLRSLSCIGNEIHTRTLPWLLNVSRNLVYLTLRDNYEQYSRGRLILPENSFRNLTSLECVDLSGIEIEGGIPKSWGNLCSLKTLDLSNNSLNGTLHDLLDSLTGCSVSSLEILSLTWNQLRGLIPDMRRFMSLRKLCLDDNELEGPLPDLSHMSSLTELRIIVKVAILKRRFSNIQY
ncbi:LRR domain containing protein [Parasponia andersonii]|uniref:LRR domain containing protein n=1 Tax=Parasponia andersonii TaxID=3476 RepID=A0A2P5CVZ2_PARAD|nr:LRR domain containing protein [Parasponia andersonii]